jgi:hypothetical protein
MFKTSRRAYSTGNKIRSEDFFSIRLKRALVTFRWITWVLTIKTPRKFSRRIYRRKKEKSYSTREANKITWGCLHPRLPYYYTTRKGAHQGEGLNIRRPRDRTLTDTIFDVHPFFGEVHDLFSLSMRVP